MSQSTSQPSPDWREARRVRGWELHQQGWTQQRIAAALGVTQGAVSQWLARGKAGAEAALRTPPRPGAPPKLAPSERQELLAMLGEGPAAHGFTGAVWTCPRIATVIYRRWKISYHPSQVGRILRSLHWSPQRPNPQPGVITTPAFSSRASKNSQESRPVATQM